MSRDHEALVRFKRMCADERNALARKYRELRRDGHPQHARKLFQVETMMAEFIGACIERSAYTGRLQ